MTRLFLVLLAAVVAAPAAEIDAGAEHYGRDAITVANDRLSLTVMRLGGSIAEIRLAGSDVNPLWDSFRNDRESGRPIRMTGGVGHFVCVDGFGPVSKEEAEAGLEGHGEAHRLYWTTAETETSGGKARLVQTVSLPVVHETLTREISLLDGENVVRVHSTLRSGLGFDRPAVWAEHATIGSPFLEPGVTVVDLSPNRAVVRPPKPVPGRVRRLAGGEEFEWPMAPLAAGGEVDLRAAPDPPNSLDHTGHLMTPSGEVAWATALHPEKNLLLGYLFKTDEFPWLQIWEHYPPEGMLARGLEFSTQIYDLPRREVISEGEKFGEPLYRWLPARSEIEATYLVFWTEVPDGMLGVSEITLEDGKLTIRDERSGKTATLETRQGL